MLGCPERTAPATDTTLFHVDSVNWLFLSTQGMFAPASLIRVRGSRHLHCVLAQASGLWCV